MTKDHYEAAKYHRRQADAAFERQGKSGANYTRERATQHTHTQSYHTALGDMAKSKGGGYRCAPNGDVWFDNGEIWDAGKFK